MASVLPSSQSAAHVGLKTFRCQQRDNVFTVLFSALIQRLLCKKHTVRKSAPTIKTRLSSLRWTHQFRCFPRGLGQEAVFGSAGEWRSGCHLLLRQWDLNCECILRNVCARALHGGAFCFPQLLKALLCSHHSHVLKKVWVRRAVFVSETKFSGLCSMQIDTLDIPSYCSSHVI